MCLNCDRIGGGIWSPHSQSEANVTSIQKTPQNYIHTLLIDTLWTDLKNYLLGGKKGQNADSISH
ncbi:hypothetical protein BX600DRAFT_452090 [Xylariales sp. PMI_506]|nr:hypothetical protein BX600DRAFT_452090 [Xylariales sp. PMI_506]